MTTVAPAPQRSVGERVSAWRRWIREHPAEACSHLFGFEPWSRQVEILEAVRDYRRVAVRSSHGLGKTAIAARAVLLYLLAHPQSRVVTTAPTFNQVEGLLWREIRSAWSELRRRDFDLGDGITLTPPNVDCSQTQLELGPEWVAVGLSTDTPERFQGQHARGGLLFVADEASGIDEAIYRAAEGYLSADNAQALLIGNPTRLGGTFHRAFQPGSGWHQIHMSTFDAPAFTGEQVSEETGGALVGRTWQAERLAEYGEDHPEYQVRVLGEFAAAEGRPFFPARQVAAVPTRVAAREGVLVGVPARGGSVRFVSQPAGGWRLWEAPRAGESYAVAADVAGEVSIDKHDARPRSAGEDACAAYVIGLSDGRTVAAYHSRPDLDTYAEQLALAGYLFRGPQRGDAVQPALVAVEANNQGHAVLALLLEKWAYPHLYHRRELDTRDGRWHRRVGWATTSATRPVMLSSLAATLRDAPQLLVDAELVAEMRVFVTDDRGRPGASTGCHDDRVMARSLGCEVFREYATPVVRLAARRKARPRPAPTSRVREGVA